MGTRSILQYPYFTNKLKTSVHIFYESNSQIHTALIYITQLHSGINTQQTTTSTSA
jgi:hypothetical protein